jgi:hypothetical protein
MAITFNLTISGPLVKMRRQSRMPNPADGTTIPIDVGDDQTG